LVIWSFDGTESARGSIQQPDTYGRLYRAMDSGPRLIPRGAGLSYCNASAGNDALSVSSRYFDRILSFDAENGIADLEPGVTVGFLTRVAASRGWYPPVLPGHPAITVGGCVGFNVHGKSQIHSGNFMSCVLGLRVYHPDHGEISCSADHNRALFDLTLGGFGLTGFVTRVRLQLARLPGRSLVRDRIPVGDLEEAVAVMQSRASSSEAVYSWHDLTRGGGGFGAGVVYAESFSTDHHSSREKHRKLTAEARRGLCFSLLNRTTAPIVNRAYHLMETSGHSSVCLPLLRGLFPISGKEIYFKLFGRRGLREYQTIVPDGSWGEFVVQLGRLIARHSIAPTLASLKLFEGRTRLLDFCGSGVGLAIDLPADSRAARFLKDLDRLVLDASGVVNLSKDSRIERSLVEKIFPERDLFLTGLLTFDPARRMTSSLRERILE
jgi:decaprenylphospho-beta-D-ribofuranose 2-oxidase